MLITVHVAPLYLVVLKHLLGALRTYERATKAAHAKRRVMMLFLFSFVQIHWMACVWSLLADPEEEIRASLRGLDPKNASADEMPESWFTSYAATIHAPPPNSDGLRYIYSIYFTLATTTTIGFGDVVPVTSEGRFVVALEMVAAVTVIPFELTQLSKALSLEEKENSSAMVDSTGDGVFDAVLLDTTGDQSPDTIRPLAVQVARLAVTCPSCALASHESDAAFCRRCGAAIGSQAAAEGECR